MEKNTNPPTSHKLSEMYRSIDPILGRPTYSPAYMATLECTADAFCPAGAKFKRCALLPVAFVYAHAQSESKGDPPLNELSSPST